MYIGKVISDFRKENNLSLQDFADKCGLTKGYIHTLEQNVNSRTGKPVTVSIEASVYIAAAMGMTLHELMSVVDENRPVCWGKLKHEIENYKV